MTDNHASFMSRSFRSQSSHCHPQKE
jgi:hypothetical protein